MVVNKERCPMKNDLTKTKHLQKNCLLNFLLEVTLEKQQCLEREKERGGTSADFLYLLYRY